MSSKEAKEKNSSNGSNLKRFNLLLPEPILDRLQSIAERDSVSVVDVIRRCLKVGFLVDEASQSEDKKILIRENNSDRELYLI